MNKLNTADRKNVNVLGEDDLVRVVGGKGFWRQHNGGKGQKYGNSQHGGNGMRRRNGGDGGGRGGDVIFIFNITINNVDRAGDV
jgi:hypothetical protein